MARPFVLRDLLRSSGVSLPSILQSGLIAEYRFDEGSGATLHDYSGHGYNGTFAAGAAAPTWHAGPYLEFNGSQSIALPALSSTPGDWTVCAVLNPNPAGAANQICFDAQTGRIACMPVYTTTLVALYNPQGYYRAGNANSAQSGWQFLCWTCKGGSNAAYIYRGSTPISPGLPYTQVALGGTVTIGANYVGTGGLVDGFSYLTVNSGAFSAAQVAQQYAIMQQIMAARGISI